MEASARQTWNLGNGRVRDEFLQSGNLKSRREMDFLANVFFIERFALSRNKYLSNRRDTKSDPERFYQVSVKVRKVSADETTLWNNAKRDTSI